MKIEIEIGLLSKAVRNIDGGCETCICNFLNNLPRENANIIAEWINTNNPFYDNEKLSYYEGKYQSGWEVIK